MKYELVLKEEADREIIESYIWYEQQQEGLGESFLTELEKYFSIIMKNPQLYAVRHDSKRAAVQDVFPT